MASRYGGKIVTDGLVLCLDAHDAKSYAGEPVTNLAASAGYPNFSNWVAEGTAEKISAGYNFQGQPVYKCNTSVGLSYQGIWRTITGLRTAASGGSVTVSVWVKNPNSTSYNFYAYIGHDFSSTRTLEANSDWQRIEWTVLESSMANDYVEYRPYTNTSGVYIHMTMPQVEVKTYATPWVDGSRSATNGWVDRSGNSNSGTLTNMAGTGTSHYRDGQVIMPIANSYLDFDGTNDELRLTSYNDLRFGDSSYSDNFSIEVWFKLDTIARSPLYDYYRYGLQVASDGTIGLWYNGNGGTWGGSGYGGSISAGVWYHGLGVHSEGNHDTVYLNGTAVSTDSTPVDIGSSTYPWSSYPYVGHTDHVGGVFTNGQIAVVRVYNKALTAAEVLSNYNATKGRYL